MSEELAPVEAETIGQIMGRNYRQSIESFRRELKLPIEAAQARAEALRSPTEENLERIERKTCDQLTWYDFEAVERHQEGQAADLWQQVLQVARQELEIGEGAADAVIAGLGTPMQRARFRVLQEALAREWQPKTGIEWSLIGQMAQTQTLFERWLSISTARNAREYLELSEWQERFEAPRVSEQEAQEHAAAMADRFHRMFQRTLRALLSTRRLPVVVQNAGQVNIGEKQVNLVQGSAAAQTPARLESRGDAVPMLETETLPQERANQG